MQETVVIQALQRPKEKHQSYLTNVLQKYKLSNDDMYDRAFYIVNLDDLVEKYRQWTSLLPRVVPYYAVKSNPDIQLVSELANLGCGFDCASAGEIRLVQTLGVAPERIIYANPMKPPSHLVYAKTQGVNFSVFDSKEELYKIHEIHPDCRLLLRIHVDDSFAICRLNGKFGAHYQEIEPLLLLSKELGLNVVGLSFHVGSGCMSTQAYDKALALARSIFDLADRLGLMFDILDIGGGFPGTWGQELINFPSIASVVAPLLDRLFPPHVMVIAEPGRYFCCSCATLVTRVVGKRSSVDSDGQKTFSYYLNDGLFGSFNCIIYDHVTPVPFPLRSSTENSTDLYKSTLFGPTCDSQDRIASGYPLPELSIGDELYFPNMGAYTHAASTQFNGFLHPKVFYLRSFELIQ
eukprot:TRINITY_DN1486_c0_g1_i1.p1 TRINITY_DN1486_c0_g1~~TRINITY_DN1486_c0_g1_i1.p1  ORF type:complete len:407 (+),score=67.00 TRINITY_DN1486_c0_g1_i1:182-1402(+)